MHSALALCWWIGGNMMILLAVTLLAAIVSLCARRAMLAALTLLLLPLAALLLPMAAVYTMAFQGCPVSDTAVGDCMLWGVPMGADLQNAAGVPSLVFSFAPYSVALALMVGLLGLFTLRPRPISHGMASPGRNSREDRA
jgi:hypothetical protein